MLKSKWYFFSLFLLILLFSACIKKHKLSAAEESFWLEVMEDIYVAKAASSKYFGFEKDSMHNYHYKEVLSKHNLDSTQIDSFMDLMIRESNLEDFYSKLIERVESLEDSIELSKERTEPED
ncbi:MAG: hypothetical protein P8P48_05030 [Saprospiraceae bacterium]|nr:hypothetical protein [Saprospiraceae bacterium]